MLCVSFEGRELHIACRWGLALVSALLLLAADASASELIRYRRADGSVGFAGSESRVPAGAEILTRKPSSESASREPGSHVPSIGQLVSGVRRHCESTSQRGTHELDDCTADQTRAAFDLRDLMLEQQEGSESFRLTERCRRRWERRRVPDYRRLLGCVEHALEELELRTGTNPADRDVDRDGSDAERDPRRKKLEQQQRLRELRSEQARAARELEIGRNRWRPRYQKAERELREAEQQVQSIAEQMRRRGCRTDSLACGGLAPKLEAARREEAEKRDYLSNGLVSECRLAGCQPGWLR